MYRPYAEDSTLTYFTRSESLSLSVRMLSSQSSSLANQAEKNHTAVVLFFSTNRCCNGRQRKIFFFGALAAFQTLFVVTVFMASSSNKPPEIIAALKTFITSVVTGTSSIAKKGQSGHRLPIDKTSQLDVRLIESIQLSSVLDDTECAETFLSHYESFCETAFVPHGENDTLRLEAVTEITNESLRLEERRHPELCPCVPRHLLSE